MKPSWDDAPEWANWLAMDRDGLWFWHEYQPEMKKQEWDSGMGMVQQADSPVFPWSQSLEPRP